MSGLDDFGWPVVTDDDGSKLVGTPFNRALTDAMKNAIGNVVFSETNPTAIIQDIMDEVIDARGLLGSLVERLDVSTNSDGTLKTSGTPPTAAQIGTLIGGVNLNRNARFRSWPNGATSAPAGFTLSGATIQRSGPAQADTTTIGHGTYAARLTWTGGVGKLTYTIMDTTEFAEHLNLKGRKIQIIARAKTGTANLMRLAVNDGSVLTQGSYAAGDSAEHWITVEHTIDAAATKIEMYYELSIAGTAYVSPFFAVFSDVPLTNAPPPMQQFADQDLEGTLSTETQVISGEKRFRSHPLFAPGSSLIQTSARATGRLPNGTSLVPGGTNLAVETTLYSYATEDDALDVNGGVIRVHAWGAFAANGNTKTLKFKYGATSVTLHAATTSGGKWHLVVHVMRLGSASQNISAVLQVETTGFSYPKEGSPAEDLTLGGPTILITGQGTANNDITISYAYAEIVG